MGSFLDKPKTEKHERSDSNTETQIRYGMSAMQGWRIDMEDAHTLVTSLPVNAMKSWSFFAVYDGHAGAKVSAEASTRLLNSILDQDYFKNTLANDENMCTECTYDEESFRNAIKNAFLELDAKMMEEDLSSGTTVVCLLITPKHLWFLNCGDSRAIHVRSGPKKENKDEHPIHAEYAATKGSDDVEEPTQVKPPVIDKSDDEVKHFEYPDDHYVYFATADHKPVNPEERQRIENAGGMVLIQRINGALAVSRALGDFDYKRVDNMSQEEQLVSPVPVISKIDRCTENDDYKDSYSIIACDGIYDVINNEGLCDYVTHQLYLDSSLEKISSKMLDSCLYRGSRDNMSAIIVTYGDNAPKVSEEAISIEESNNKLLKERVGDLYQTVPKNNTQVETMCGMLPASKYGCPGMGVHGKRELIKQYVEELAKQEPGTN